MSIKLKLSKPIEAHGNQIDEIELREPLGKDVRKCGLPFTVVQRESGAVGPEYNTEAAAKMISELSGIPPSSVDKMSAADFTAAMDALFGFFGPSPPQTS